jgi:tRNA-dihydrouridine synthase B
MHTKPLSDDTLSPPRLYMAPIRGVTDHIYRNTFAEHFNGFDLSIAPFIASPVGSKIRQKYLKGVLPENNPNMPVIPQILSKSADGFILLASRIFDLGYETVNWNLGCPYPQVANKQRGSGLLPHTDLIQSLLDHVIPSINGQLSIKTRLGRNTKKEIFALLPVLDAYPIQEIIIHPRTGVQMYEGTPDLDAFEACLNLTRHPVVYNGDIRTADDFNRLSGRFATINRWMIGRGALMNPFLPEVIKTENKPGDRIKKLKSFHDALFVQYSRVLSGPTHILDRMKGLWKYFSQPFSDDPKHMKKIKKAKTLNQYRSITNTFFENNPHLRF